MRKHKKIIQQPKTISEIQTPPCQPSVLSLLLADSIFVFHSIIILFMLFAPYTNTPAILVLHITFALSLMIHWYANSNICCLSILEANLRDLNTREDTFSHRFIAPIYDVSATEWSTIVWIVTSVVLCISVYKLYHTDKFKTAWKCYSESNPKTTTFSKITQFLECFKPLFIID